jgi:cytochrome c-type biogenesis protein CcmI
MGVMLGALMLILGVVLFLLLPILRGEWAGMARSKGELTDAEARKRAALKALRDVEYDYHTGKLDDADYSDLKTALSRDALHAMKRADQAEQAESGEVASAHSGSAATTGDDDLEAEIERARAGLRAGRACGNCGELNVEGSRFCVTCGATLASEAAQA